MYYNIQYIILISYLYTYTIVYSLIINHFIMFQPKVVSTSHVRKQWTKLAFAS